MVTDEMVEAAQVVYTRSQGTHRQAMRAALEATLAVAPPCAECEGLRRALEDIASMGESGNETQRPSALIARAALAVKP